MLKQPSILLAFDWYDRRLFEGIIKYASQQDWHISPYAFSDRNIPYGWRGDGAITCYGKVFAEFINSLNVPMVDISVLKTPRATPKIVTDNREVGGMAAEHFLERGFKNFAYYSWQAIPVNLLRRRYFFDALRIAGVPAKSIYEIRQSPARIMRNWPSHQDYILKQIEKLPRPLAVFTGQDNLAATLVEICTRHGIHVPEEIAVLGVDNIEILCDCQIVPLSSIDTRLSALGYAAAERLHQLIDGKIENTAEDILVHPGSIICRRSTDVLAIPHAAVARAVRFIKDNISAPVTLEDIAAHAGMSKRGIEKAFINHLGRTPAAELLRCRLDLAKKMLADGNAKIEYIARCCGYSNSSNLSHALRRDTGLSPREYRTKFNRG